MRVGIVGSEYRFDLVTQNGIRINGDSVINRSTSMPAHLRAMVAWTGQETKGMRNV